jgi:hypothetical protein
MKLKPNRALAPVIGMLLLAAVMTAISMANKDAFEVQAEPADKHSDFPIHNPIDKFILERLDSEKVDPSVTCTDEEFCRRAYLDVCGVIPTREQIKLFLGDRNPEKRSKLVDNLLKSDRYAQHWEVMWGDVLREHTQSKRQEGTERGSYRTFLREALASNMPYDAFARRLITASGSPEDNPAVNFYLRDENDRVETSNTIATAFMGTRMACAQCHDHPFDKWTQNDFHNLMSFTASRTRVIPDQIHTILNIEADVGFNRDPEMKKMFEPYYKDAHEAKEAAEKNKLHNMLSEPAPKQGAGMGMEMSMAMPDMMIKDAKGQRARNIQNELMKAATKEQAEKIKQVFRRHQVRDVMEANDGEYNMPAEGDSAKKGAKNSGEVVAALFPWDNTKKAEGKGSRRKALAEYITNSKQFAAVQVNRLWAQLFGHGIVDPVDDFREKNTPSHPELLDWLTNEFIKCGFDNKHMIKTIMMSSTYQRSTIPNSTNKSDSNLFSHQRLRRMTAEQTFDSMLVASGFENGLENQTINVKDYAGGKKAGGGKQSVQWAEDLPTPARTGTFMNLFNQPSREQTAVKRDETGSISQALELMNGDALNKAIANSPLAKQLADSKNMSGQQVATELYLAILSRQPSADELRFVATTCKGPITREWVDDIYWALLNSREFMFVK